MTKFTFGTDQKNLQYVQIKAEIPVTKEETVVRLPSWRPGRYELGNFAKNVRDFKVFNEKGEKLPFRKITKDAWKVETTSEKAMVVKYNYYASELNAGSTFLDEYQLYVNPVNCCVYTDETFDDAVELLLNVPDFWEMATSLERKKNCWFAENMDEFLDSPFISSGMLQHQSYECGGVKFHVWFNGEVKPDWDRVINDFAAFTETQIAKFTEFPVREYHFLNQILPYKAYHGVEHQKSTVIALGPSYDVFDALYTEFLGVSSHELYHAWNVKAIRPIEMYPYDFSKENYSPLGYLCEGVTTYQGDLLLFKSGVFDEPQYLKELTRQVQRHFDNDGRFHYSVAASSWDTWLDGYVAGAPGRKVSIYTEGCLLAFVTDIMIRRATKDKYGLDEVMKRLYFHFYLNGKGVSEEDYQSVIEHLSGISFNDFFADYIHGTRPFESIITESLTYLGYELKHVPDPSYTEGRLGLKTLSFGKEFKVSTMYPGGPAEMAGLMVGDVILAVNGYVCDGELDKWLKYFDDDTKTVTVNRGGNLIELTFPEINRNFYMKYSIEAVQKRNSHQEKAFKAWKS